MKIIIYLALTFFFPIQLCHGQTELWGSTSEGGTSNLGTIFKANEDGTNQTVQYSFSTTYTGNFPAFTRLTEANGKLYGVTQRGGASGTGVLFEFDPTSSAYKVILEFVGANGSYPTGSVTLASNGKLYGLTQGNLSDGGSVIFSYDPVAKTYTKIIDLDGVTGTAPQGSLSLGSNGKLYGLTRLGGANGKGTIIEFDPATNSLIKKFDFDGINGGNPTGSDIVQASNGKFYGMTFGGGSKDMGVLFEYNLTTSAYSKKIDFDGTNGSNPQGSLVEFSDGKLYGMNGFGGANFGGVLFSFDPSSGILQKKIDLDYNNGDAPYGSLLLASNGKMYALTLFGGLNGQGTLFEYDPSQNSITAKVNLDYSNGENPIGSLMQASNGLIYGMAAGGKGGDGVIFEYSITSDTYTKKLDFDFAPDGSYPIGAISQFYNGKFYGVTEKGGLSGLGVLFEFDPILKTYTKKVDFDGLNGSSPNQGLVLLKDKFYGTTNAGGKNGSGVIFQFDPTTNVVSNIFDFIASTGSFRANLVIGSDANFYGTTEFGGLNNVGVIFKFEPTQNTYTKLYDFDGLMGRSYGGLMQATDGKLYGTTNYGGNSNDGVLFSFDIADNFFQKISDFTSDTGTAPTTSLLQSPNGKFYGLTSLGGASGHGTLYEYDPATNNITKKVDFDYPTSGGYPSNNMMQSSNGKIYGILNGGPIGKGVFFEYDPSSGVFTKKIDFNGSNGATSQYGSNTLVKPLQSITFDALASKTYGDLPFNLSASSNSGLQISYTSSDPTIASINGSVVTILKAGVVTITAHQPGDLNTFQARDVSQSLTINKANLTLTADNKSKTFGSANPQFTVTYSGLIGTDNATSIDTPPTISCAASQMSDAGLYPITLSGGSSTNYNLLMANGTLTITKAPLTITADNKTKTFGSANPQFTMTYSGFVGTDGVGVIDSPPSVSSAADATSLVGNYPITLTGGSDSNYAFTLNNGTLTVIKADQTITFNTIADKKAGDSPFALTATTSSGLDVVYATQSGKVSIAGNQASIIATGRETIFAKQDGNSLFDAAPTQSQSFCINPPKPTITQVAQPSGSATLTSSAQQGNQWYANDSPISSATNNTFFAKEPGVYKVRVTVDDCVSEFSETISVVITGDIKFDESPTLFPIPATSFVFIKGANNASESRVVDAMGKHQTISLTKEEDFWKADIKHLPSGVYVLQFVDNNNLYFLCFVKQ